MGFYMSNGVIVGILKCFLFNLEKFDLFIFGLLVFFKGYEVGYLDIGD